MITYQSQEALGPLGNKTLPGGCLVTDAIGSAMSLANESYTVLDRFVFQFLAGRP